MSNNLGTTIPSFSKNRSVFNKSKVIRDAIKFVERNQTLTSNFFVDLIDIILPTVIEKGIPILKYDALQPGSDIEKHFQRYGCDIPLEIIPKLASIRRTMKLIFHHPNMLKLIHRLYVLNEHSAITKNFKRDIFTVSLLDEFGSDNLSQIKMFFTLFNIYDDLLINLILKKFNIPNIAIPEIRAVITSRVSIDVYHKLVDILNKYVAYENVTKFWEYDTKLYKLEKEKKLRSKTASEKIQQKEQALNQKEQVLNQKEQGLKNQEQIFNQKEQALKDQEQALKDQEQTIKDQEQKLNDKQNLHTSNVLKFNEKASDLIKDEHKRQLIIQQKITTHLTNMQNNLANIYNSSIAVLENIKEITNNNNYVIDDIYKLLEHIDSLSIETEFDSIKIIKNIVDGNISNPENITIYKNPEQLRFNISV